MKATIPDQALMAEAADEIKRLKLEVASFLKKGLIEADERAEDADDLYESVLHKSANDQEKLEEEREELENKIEFLEADRLRLANLIHPDSGICTVYAGKCWECDKEMKRLDEQTANLIRREADAKAARDVATRSLDLQRQINQNLTLQQEQRNADVRALCDAVSQLMPTSRTLKPLVEKVKESLQ